MIGPQRNVERPISATAQVTIHSSWNLVPRALLGKQVGESEGVTGLTLIRLDVGAARAARMAAVEAVVIVIEASAGGERDDEPGRIFGFGDFVRGEKAGCD